MLKKGQRVQINSGGKWASGAYDGMTAICLDDSISEFDIVDIKLDTGIVIFPADLEYLTPVEPSIDNLMVGDVVECQLVDGHKKYTNQKVNILGILNDDCIFTDYWKIISKKQLKEWNCKVISPSPSKTVLTKKMIAYKFNIDEDDMEIINQHCIHEPDLTTSSSIAICKKCGQYIN